MLQNSLKQLSYMQLDTSTKISACAPSSAYATLSSASELVATVAIPAAIKRKPGRTRKCDSILASTSTPTEKNAIIPLSRRLTRLQSTTPTLTATPVRGKKHPITEKNKGDIETG